jgi:hypothetical protein
MNVHDPQNMKDDVHFIPYMLSMFILLLLMALWNVER